MSLFHTTTRRACLAAQGAWAILLAMPGATRANAASIAAGAEPVRPEPEPARWATATAEELRRHIGARFRVRTQSGENFVMRLTALEPASSGPHRPRDLLRAEGVTAVFDSPDLAPLKRAGCQTCRVSHPSIGAADLMLSLAPRRSGGHLVELVLN